MTKNNKRSLRGILTAAIFIVLLLALLFAVMGYMVIEL